MPFMIMPQSSGLKMIPNRDKTISELKALNFE